MAENITGDTIAPPTPGSGGWTFGTLIEWIKVNFEMVWRVLGERQRAVEAAFENFTRWMAGTNEWRGTFEDLLKTRVSQEAFDALAARVKRLEDGDIRGTGKAQGVSQSVAIGLGTLTVISIAFSIVMALITFN